MELLGPPYPPRIRDEPFWGYTYRDQLKKNSDCTEITLTNHITLPRWINRDDAPILLRLDWGRMLRSLRRHERGHAKINVWAAKEHLRAKCTNKEAIKAKRRLRHKHYDKLTNHGIRTGAFLF